MKKFYLCVAFFSIAVCYVCLFVFRQLPAGELWSGYSVLYVHDSIPEETVFNTLSESGINEVTCLSNQFLPIDLKADSCEVSLIPLNPDSVDYLLKKSNYFFDRSHSYRLYYIPVFYKQKLNQTVQLISKKGFSGNCGIDTKSSYPFLIPLSVFLFSVFLFFYSKKRFLFGSLSLLPLSYSVSFPFLSSALSCFILNLIFYLFSNIYGRRDFINFIFKKYIFIILFFISFVSNFTSGFLSGFIYLLVVFSSVSVLYIFDLFQYIKNRSFKPVMIRSSFFVSCFNGKEKYIFPFVSLLIVICIIFSVFTSGKSFDSNNKIAFPSVNAGIKSSELPNLEDYYTWDFTVRSFPYKSLNDLNNSENVKLSRFKKNEGVVTEYFEEMSFSDSYKDTVYNKIDLLSFNAFEKIMKKQGENFNAGYSSNGSHHLNLFCIIITFIQFVLILVYTFWIISNRKIRGRK